MALSPRRCLFRPPTIRPAAADGESLTAGRAQGQEIPTISKPILAGFVRLEDRRTPEAFCRRAPIHHQDELKQVQAQKAAINRRFAKLDANGDGQITLDEYASAGHDVMSYVDLNQDGEVTAWEYRAVRVLDR